MSWSFYLTVSHSGPKGMKVGWHFCFLFDDLVVRLLQYGVVGQNDFDFSFSVVS
jgi:hypothetical protein